MIAFAEGGSNMLTWLSENLATIVITAMLLAVLTGIVVCLVRNKKQGKTTCGCGCESCALHGRCHPKK